MEMCFTSVSMLYSVVESDLFANYALAYKHNSIEKYVQYIYVMINKTYKGKRDSN